MSGDPRAKYASQGLGMPPPSDNLRQVVKQKAEGQRYQALAEEMYPYLKKFDVSTIVNPQRNRGWAETYSPSEPGAPNYPRPQGLPMGKLGIEIYRKDMRPIDYLGEVISHYAVENEPMAKQLYGSFAKTMNHNMTVPQYEYARQNYGESRPYNAWYAASGLPGYFRGHLVNQWPETEMYTGQQLEMQRVAQKRFGIK